MLRVDGSALGIPLKTRKKHLLTIDAYIYDFDPRKKKLSVIKKL